MSTPERRVPETTPASGTAIHPGDRLIPVRGSVRRKLMGIVLMTTMIALLAAGIAFLTEDLTVSRRSWASDLATEASILALSTGPALAFNDHEVASRNLTALQARSEVVGAALYQDDGTLYASYVRAGFPPPPLRLRVARPEIRIRGQWIEVSEPLVQHDERLGTIFLRARYDVSGRVEAYLSIFALITLVSLIMAMLLSVTLQKGITGPLESMAGVARRVVTGGDYSLRAEVAGEDEIGLVVRAFNRMLDEVQSRTQALEQSNVALQQEVKVRETAEAALARANARLESSMEAAEIGGWVWDVRRNEWVADRNLAALYGLSDAREISGDPTKHRHQIHPEDLARVIEGETGALREGVLALSAFRILRPDGSVRWLMSRGRAQLDQDGTPVLLAALVIDITAQKRAEQALRESEKLYRAIGESIDFGVWVADASGRNIYVSESFLHLTGFTQAQCSALGWGEALHPEEARASVAAWQECVRKGGSWYREHRIRGRDGQYHPILSQGVAIKDEYGQVTGWAGINLDISRLKQTEEALRAADRRKDEFLATLAHELRNPLQPIRHAAALLEESSATERQRQWGREIIARQVHRMALLLDDLLDVSRITRGRLELKKSYVELKSLVSSAVETARPLIEAKHHRLSIELPSQPLELEVDPLRVSQALSNLLTNAAKYTDEGGRIELRVTVESEQVVASVQDNGIGLEPNTLLHVFEMFSQVQSALDRAQGGLGIGLALVKGLIELHGGTVEAESAGLGQGSRFVIRLPQSVLVNRMQPVVEADERGDVRTPRHCKVLVVDDNFDAADSLGTLLQVQGHEVWIAHSGTEALALGARARPEVIILDIGMPDMSGYEVARRIRQEAWGDRALLIAATGWGQESDKAKARAAGFDEHFTKPVAPDAIQQLLLRFVNERASATQLTVTPAHDRGARS